ncbi:hypothetical protein [uncultured Pseudoteredinibacter sp.]|uniref:hypothetical protein n=1 Tax=uncultured Pseudoteredinibacter sp. TaxID=1641701 RepID=UPI00260AAF0D|nr:hypothetical protein [uncultured Pseudoteredinibacter sp.]
MSSPKYFDRTFLLRSAGFFLLLSMALSFFHPASLNLFSSAGAVVTVAGLFLNIKHTLLFHRDETLEWKYNTHKGAFRFGTNQLNDKQKDEINEVLRDEKFGVTLMVVGTLIWAYGTYLIMAIKSIF